VTAELATVVASRLGGDRVRALFGGWAIYRDGEMVTSMGSKAILTPDQIGEVVGQPAVLPLRIVQVRALFTDAWRLRKNLTFADATYVALAERLSAEWLTDRPLRGAAVEDNPAAQRTPAARLTGGLAQRSRPTTPKTGRSRTPRRWAGFSRAHARRAG
jgi:hypothetical protein